MIRQNKDLSKMSDDEFENIVIPFENKISDYVYENIVDNYVAYYIATAYNMNALWDGKIELTIESAIDKLGNYLSDNYNIKKIKSILEKEYKLKVVSDDPTDIKEIK